MIAYVPYAHDEDKTRKVVNNVAIDDGSRGIEHLVSCTMEQFERHANEAELEEDELFCEFTNCLEGATLRMGEQIVKKDFKTTIEQTSTTTCGNN